MVDNPSRTQPQLKLDDKRHLFHVNHRGGHHSSYEALFEKLFGLTASVGAIDRKRARLLLAADRLFFGTIDDDVLGFARIALRRELRGRRTAGIFMQPQTCFSGGVRAKIKRLAFALMCRLPGTEILSIVPFSAVPEASQVATDWVHDPQLWDKVDEVRNSSNAHVSTQFAHAAGGRPILAYVGTVTSVKGINHLADIMTADADIGRRLCVIVAGAVQRETGNAADAIEKAGGVVIDRRISDEELFALYRAATAVWCAYVPEFDQASGIFGRAIQFGRRPVIREGARVVGHYAQTLDTRPIILSGVPVQDAAVLVSALEEPMLTVPDCSATLRKWRTDFVARIEQAMGNN